MMKFRHLFVLFVVTITINLASAAIAYDESHTSAAEKHRVKKNIRNPHTKAIQALSGKPSSGPAQNVIGQVIKALSINQAYAVHDNESQYWINYLDSRSPNSDLRDPFTVLSDDDIFPNFSYAGYDFANSAIPESTGGTGYGDSVPVFDPELTTHKVFNVVDYGAMPDDAVSDKAAIKATIEAAENYVENGGDGAIVYFPTGRFLVNEDSDMVFTDENAQPVSVGYCDGQSVACIGSTMQPGDDVLRKNAATNQPFFIRTGNIIVRGSGSGEGGTQLYMKNHFVTPYYNVLYETPHLFMIGQFADDYWQRSSGGDESSAYLALHEPKSQPASTGIGALITRITSNALRDTTRTVSVEDASALFVGQWVRLHSVDTRVGTLSEVLGPYEPEPLFSKTGSPWWTGLNRGFEQRQLNKVIAVDSVNNTVTFAAPISADIEASSSEDNFGWVIEVLEYTENVGVEDLAIVGNAPAPFVHHKNYVHDSGWSGLNMFKTVNSWVRNVRFESMSEGLQVVLSCAMTLQDIDVGGNAGHLSVAIENSSNVLGLNIAETASTWHAAGFSNYAAGNVILNHQYPADTSPNIHASFPRANLFDGQTGGWIHGHWGGALSNTPNHMKHLVWWNPVNLSKAENDWEFMQSDSKYGRIIMPYVIGMTGNVHTFADQARYYNNQVDLHYTKTGAVSGDGRDYITGFDESHSNCYETPESDTDDQCDLPSTVEDAATAITYTDVGGNADFPALFNPYSAPLSSEKLQAFVESAGQRVGPVSLYEAQLQQRLGQLPEWLVSATDKVRYVSFQIATLHDGGSVPVSGTLRVYGSLGQLITATPLTFSAIPASVTVDLGGYYNLSEIAFVPDATSSGLVASFAVYSNQTDLGSSDWGDADVSGTMGNSVHIQRFSPGESQQILISALDSNEQQVEVVSDSDNDTYWMASQAGTSLYFDLQRPVWAESLNMAFFNGASNQFAFDLAYSDDLVTWTLLSDPTNTSDDFVTSGTSSQNETLALATPVQARYWRVTAQTSVAGSDDFALAEFSINEQSEPGLVSYLPLNEGVGATLLDATGLQSPMLVNSERVNGVIFDGIDDYVELGDFDPADGAFSVALWAKLEAQSSTAFLLRKHSWGTANPYYLQLTSSGVLSARVNGSGVTADNMADGLWHHITMTLDNTILSFYVDGEFMGSATVSPVSNDTPVTLGGDPSGRYPFTGAIDDVRFYSSVLSHTDVQALAAISQVSQLRGSCDSDDSGMLAFYPFEDADPTDSAAVIESCEATGTGPSAYLANGAGWGDTVNAAWQGEVTGLTFDGVDDYLTLSDIDYGVQGELTVALWTRFTNQASTAFLLRKGNYGSSNPYYIQVNTNGTLLARVNGAGPSVSYINDNQWHHVAMVLSGNSLALYVDGDYHSDATVIPVSNNTPVTIGGESGGSKPFAGSVDDVAIYQRALTATEVSELAASAQYNANGDCNAVSDTDLAVYLPLQDGKSVTCDVSGNDSHAILGNAPVWEYQTTWLALDGEDDQIMIGEIGYGQGETMSVSFWLRAELPDDVSYLFQKATWIGNSPLAVYLRTDGALRAGVLGTEAEISNVADGHWHHIVTVLEGSTLLVYMDGELVTSQTVSPGDDSGLLTVGGATGLPHLRAFQGALDEIRIYQSAVSADVVSELYMQGH